MKQRQSLDQWYNANTGEPIDMALPSIAAFRAGDIDKAIELAKLENAAVFVE